jgi:glycosyltransferase involved in cell wall biosynthesis
LALGTPLMSPTLENASGLDAARTANPLLPGPVSIVMLVYNEAEVIEHVVRGFHEEVIRRVPGSEFIVAEDGSRDGTTEILERLRDELGIRLIHRDERRGYTRALKDALALTRHDLVFFSDSDGQHDPGDFWRLAKQIPYCDMVIGFKQPRHDPAYRLVMSRVFNRLIGALFKFRFHDVNCGFRLMRRRLVEDLLQDEWQMKACTFTEFTIRAFYKGYAIREAPVRHLPRPFGESRGLPLRGIPKSIAHILRQLADIRRRIKAGTL